MSTSGPLHPLRDDLSAVDATFEIDPLPIFELTYHHKAGRRHSPGAVNSDYHEGLELILGRLAELSVTILGISLDSRVALKLSPEQRELDLQFPIDLSVGVDAHKLRLAITRAQRPVARRGNVKAVGGNDQKRIKMTISDRHGVLTFRKLRDVLLSGEGPEEG